MKISFQKFLLFLSDFFLFYIRKKKGHRKIKESRVTEITVTKENFSHKEDN